MSANRTDFHSWLALGDSYTIGESVEAGDRYPCQTVKLLENSGIFFSDPEFLATTGWTTADLLAAIPENKFSRRAYDVVSLLIGVNNQYLGRSLTEYWQQFSDLLKQSIQLSGDNPSHVVVLSIPDYSVTPYARNDEIAIISRQIDNFNTINKELAISNHVQYINITDESRIAAKDPLLLSADGLHYSKKEYAVWAAMLAQSLNEILK